MKIRYKYYIKKHEQTHSGQIYVGEKPFYCSKCKISFLILLDLDNHIKCSNHYGERPYSCSLCNQTFPQFKDIKGHYTATHMKRIPNFCKHCDKGTQQDSHWREAFYCMKCVKNFQKLKHLKKHKQYQDGEKPFACVQTF